MVDQTIYCPSAHSSSINPGITLGGDISFTSINVSVAEKHGIVFKCQHGKFYIERKDLWEKLSAGDCVEISYKELFRAVYEDGKLISRDLFKLDFIDAVKTECN